MQILAFWNPLSFEIVYSRHRHDFITDSRGNFIDGGQGTKFYRIGGNDLGVITCPLYIWLEGVEYSDLYNDYNFGWNKYGKLSLLDAQQMFLNKGKVGSDRVLKENEIQDVDTFEYKKNNLVWGTYGKEGKGPMRYKNAVDLDTDHIEAILKTQLHVTEDTRKIFRSILEDRKISG